MKGSQACRAKLCGRRAGSSNYGAAARATRAIRVKEGLAKTAGTLWSTWVLLPQHASLSKISHPNLEMK